MSFNYTFLEQILFPNTTLKHQVLSEVLTNKTIVITGATFGIGEELTYILSAYKVNLILVARTEEKLTQIKSNLSNTDAQILTFATDLYNENEVNELITSIYKTNLTVDFIVCNAGKSIRRSIFESVDRYHDFTRTISLNYLANVNLILGLLPHLEKSKGQIINVSALNVKLNVSPYWSAYQASKCAMEQWILSISPELKLKNITCTNVYLPLVRTRMIKPTAHYQSFPAMHPKHVAIKIANAFISKTETIKPWWLNGLIFCNFLLKPFWSKISYILLKKNLL
ncbi:MAG: Fatty acyl-CoA reductase [Bacteroidota bacterium]|jgi:short-subunit dehydrogenase